MSPIYESCLLSMSHVSYLWVMSPIYESCLLSMSHVSYLWVMSPIYGSCLLSMGHVSYLRVMSHLLISMIVWQSASCLEDRGVLMYETCDMLHESCLQHTRRLMSRHVSKIEVCWSMKHATCCMSHVCNTLDVSCHVMSRRSRCVGL